MAKPNKQEPLEQRLLEILSKKTPEMDDIALAIINENSHLDGHAAYFAWKLFSQPDFPPLAGLRTKHAPDATKADAYCLTAAELGHPEAKLVLALRLQSEKKFKQALDIALEITSSAIYKEMPADLRKKIGVPTSDLIELLEHEIEVSKRMTMSEVDITLLQPIEAYNLCIEILGKIDQSSEDQKKIRDLLIHAKNGGVFQASKLMTKLKLKAD